jgi:hypothetical protein
MRLLFNRSVKCATPERFVRRPAKQRRRAALFERNRRSSIDCTEALVEDLLARKVFVASRRAAAYPEVSDGHLQERWHNQLLQ